MSARVLGVDPGTRAVGYGLVDVRGSADFSYVECGVIKAGHSDMALRLHEITRTLEEIIQEFNPTVMALEAAYHGRNASSALKLGQSRGAIMVVGARRGLEVCEYPPARVKRAVAGNGQATKEQIQTRVTLLCELRRAPESDAADALAIALCHVFGGVVS